MPSVCDQGSLGRKPKASGAQAEPAVPGALQHAGTYSQSGYLVHDPSAGLRGNEGQVWLLYARPLSDIDHTLARVQVFLLAGRARRHRAGPAGRPGHGGARHAPGRRADRGRAGDRAHPRSQPASAPSRGQRRGGRARAHARGHARGAGRRARADPVHARPPARVRRRRLARAAHAADQRAGQPRAAGRGARRRAGRLRAGSRCARPAACAAWSATCCCWPGPTPSARRRCGPPIWPR